MNLKGMQVVETVGKEQKRERNYPSDTNIRQMGMGSWHASLSRGGQAYPPLKGIRQPERKGKS